MGMVLKYWRWAAAWIMLCSDLLAQPLVRTGEVMRTDTVQVDALTIACPDSLLHRPDRLLLFARQAITVPLSASALPHNCYQTLVVLDNAAQDTTARLLAYFKLNVNVVQCLRLSNRHAPVIWHNSLASWQQQSYQPLWYWPEQMRWLLVLEPGQRDTLVFQITHSDFPQLLLANARHYQQQSMERFIVISHWQAAQIGLFTILTLLSLWRYYQRRDLAYIYYAVYLVATSLLVWRQVQFRYLSLQWLSGPEWWINLWRYARMPIFIVLIMAYQSFFQAMVNDRHQWPFLSRLVRYGNYSLLGAALLDMLFLQRIYHFSIISQFLDIFLIVGITAWLLALAVLWRSGLTVAQSWVFAGTLCLVGGVLTAVVMRAWYPQEQLYRVNTPDDLALSIGVLAEVLCFAAALAYRHREVLRQRDAAQQAYLTQLEASALATQQYQEELNRQLQAEQAVLEKQYKTVQLQRLAVIEAEYRQAVAETQLMALRGHLQPHFVVNCINSMRNLVVKNQLVDAEQYLEKLSRMLRLVFEHTGRPAVSLREELDLLRLYLDLEKLRFRERFTVVENFPANPDLSGQMIPPLLLQPYAENAVKHAFPVANPANRLLIGTGYRADGVPICYLEDNGVGRAAAAAQPAAARSGHGLALCTERLRLYNERFQTNFSVEIIDLIKNDQPAGTRVEILLPNIPIPQYPNISMIC
jgi:sensor histidine kinase YesM